MDKMNQHPDRQFEIFAQFLDNQSLIFRREHEREGIKLEVNGNRIQFETIGGGFDLHGEEDFLNDEFQEIQNRLTSTEKLESLQEILKTKAEDSLGQTFIGIEAQPKRAELMAQIGSEVGKGPWRPAIRDLVKRFGIQTTINVVDIIIENSKK